MLSMELDATLAVVMFNDWALAIITLLSKPSFFDMSYIRRGINIFYRDQPECAIRLHGLKRNHKNVSD